MLRTGTVLDRRYRIEHVIKQGGMGTVYAAQDLRLDRPCAVKAVQATTEQERAQYEREARVLGRLCHPHLPAIFDCLEEEDSVFVVMQMIPGDDLEAMTLRSGPPVWETLVGWGLQLAEAVQYLHDQAPPVIHRDIKPANIRLAPHGQIYLVDFGIAKVLDGAATVTAARAASVPYAPIEQVQDGSHTNQQSDIYSFGATLYRLLTGTLPPSCIDRLVGKDLPPVSSFNPAVPDSLARLVHHCMELWSTDRPATMTAVIATLRPLQLGVTQTIPEARTLPMNTFSGGTTRRTEAVGHTPQAYGALKAGLKSLERGDAETARGLFTQAIELAKAFAEAYAARAAACTQLGLYHAALEDWNAAINLRPRRSAWYRQRALVHRQLEDTAAAIADLSTAIELDENNVEAHFERAMVRRDVGDARGHLQDLDRVLSLAPDHRLARRERVHARMEHQLWQAALPDCNTLIEADPNAADGYVLRARVYSELGDITRSLRDLAQAVAVDSQSAEAYFLRGRLLQRSGNRQAALRDFNRALELDPEHAEARYRRAQVYRAQGADREALDDYRALTGLLRSRLAQRPGSEPVKSRHQAHSPIVEEIQYMMRTSGIEKARRYLQSQADVFLEDHDEDLEERAALYERVGQVDAALDDLERAVKLLWSRQRRVALPPA